MILMEEIFERISWEFEDGRFEVECCIRRSTLARRIHLKVPEPQRVILTLPKRASLRNGRNFLMKNGGWIREKSKQLPEPKTLAEYFKESNNVWIDSDPREVTWEFDPGKKRSVREIGRDQIKFTFFDASNLEFLLLKECIHLGKEILPERLIACQNKVGIQSKKIRIGNQRSRWGSCSGRGTISLNWRILLLPFELGEYVIYHEIVHLEQMNHSPQFWNRLEQIVPNAKKVDKELMRAGKEIISLGHPPRWSE